MDGTSMQKALRDCKMTTQDRITEAGWTPVHYLILGQQAFEVGGDRKFVESLIFAIKRNAEVWETDSRRGERMAHFVDLAAAVLDHPDAPEELKAKAMDLITLKPPTL